MSDEELPEGVRVPDDLGARAGGDDGLTATPSSYGEHGAVTVIAGIDLPAGSPYVTEVSPSDDVVLRLPREQAIRYAMTVLDVAHRAHYLAAVRAQMLDMLGSDGDPQSVLYLLQQFVRDLPEIDDAATAPLRLRAQLRRSTGREVVLVSLPPHTELLTGWSFVEARNHALHVLDQAVVSRLDTGFRDLIAVHFELGEQRARAAVADLGRWFPTPAARLDDTVSGSAGPGTAAPGPAAPGPGPRARPGGGRKKKRGRR